MASIAPIIPSKHDEYGPTNLLPQQLGIGSIPQGIALKRETQPDDSPKVQTQELPKQCFATIIATTEEQDEHKLIIKNMIMTNKYHENIFF